MKEPVVFLDSIAELIRQIIPFLLAFGLIHWTDEQIGQTLIVVGVIITLVKTMITRQLVVPTAKAKEQIAEAINSPSNLSVDDVIARVEEKNVLK